MRVLMISLDKGLAGGTALGDVRDRHIAYGQMVDALDIIVLTKKGYHTQKLSKQVSVYPTNSVSKLLYYTNTVRLAASRMKQVRYDLIVTQDPFVTGLIGVSLKNRSDAKLLVDFHGDYGNSIITNYVTRNADAIRVMSQGQKTEMVNNGIPDEKIRILNTPINLDKFLRQADLLSNNTSKSTKFQVLYAGRLSKEKNIELLIRSAKLIQQEMKPGINTIFVIAGEGKMLPSLKKQAGDSGFIRFTGHKDQNELIELYNSSDVVVLPSRRESFGKVLVEANACGKPVIATKTSGALSIIRDGYNGFIVPQDDAEALAHKILALYEDKNLAKQMGENGKKLVREKYANGIQEVISYWRQIAGQV